MNIREINLPRIPRKEYPEGKLSGYYTFSQLRNALRFSKGPDFGGFWYDIDAEKDLDLQRSWYYLDCSYPKKEPVYLSCGYKKFQCVSILTNSPELICNKQIKHVIESFSLDPKLKIFECKFFSKGKIIKSAHSYFGIYGERCQSKSENLPDSVSIEDFVESMNNPYEFYYIDYNQEEMYKYDLFVGSQFQLFFSELLVTKLLDIDPMLQFDPVISHQF